MRGMLGLVLFVDLQDRIIPAYAGNASTSTCCRVTSPDHPRVCGECTIHSVGPCFSIGSSPRMRGMRGCGPQLRRRGRIIPAYAGNALPPARRWPPPTDHPRVCGECRQRLLQVDWRVGSSPRMRGMLVRLCHQLPRHRIIPAYAGNATKPDRSPTHPTDHPRVCGECPAAAAPAKLRCGSSPRMRGMREAYRVLLQRDWIIPAYAGNARALLATAAFRADHPRGCGECCDCVHAADCTNGSSPRMRGMPQHGGHAAAAVGSSPRMRGMPPQQ